MNARNADLDFAADLFKAADKTVFSPEFVDVRSVLVITDQDREASEDFSRKDITDFQALADEFGELWWNLAGKRGQSNYVHMIVSGHVAYFMKEYCNLYRFSQQSVEKMGRSSIAHFCQ